ncbi:hypothetical protein CHS0354_017700 [Potamilus streckersoni]|uniref:Uncharacterized protein n=1 Tax=Potamilus streckersoni TaxID=2493646 RepID=A0AAE0SHM7_9BIVA|nr:hypothetical protein CHS0354_017700 [Potamilus streckersoni]
MEKVYFSWPAHVEDSVEVRHELFEDTIEKNHVNDMTTEFGSCGALIDVSQQPFYCGIYVGMIAQYAEYTGIATA